MFHVWEKRRRRQEEAGQVTDEGGAFIPTLGVHPRNNRVKKRRRRSALPKHRALANEGAAAVAAPPRGAALLTAKAWLRALIESNDN